MLSNGDMLFHLNVSAPPGETWTPEIVFSATVGKLGIRWGHPHREIEMKFCVVGGLQEIVLTWSSTVRILSKSIKRFRSCGGRNLTFLVDLAICLYKIVISQQIKEVIANGHDKLNEHMIAQTP